MKRKNKIVALFMATIMIISNLVVPVKEVSVHSPYLLDKTPKTVTVKANETAKVS